MLLGLLRSVVLTAIGIAEAYRQSPDKIVNWREVRRQTVAWLFPVTRLVASAASLQHVFFLIPCRATPGSPIPMRARPAMEALCRVCMVRHASQFLANYLTVLVVVAGMALFLSRVLDSRARKISRLQDFAWPLFLVVPFITGFLCTNLAIGPKTYQSLMLLHVYSANLIMLLIPFTKISHCVLAPLSQTVTAIAWKFPAGAGDRVAATLGYADRPTWLPKARLEIATAVHGKVDNQMKAAILTDTTKCNNCHECVAACKKQNQLPVDLPRRWDLDDGLSA